MTPSRAVPRRMVARWAGCEMGTAGKCCRPCPLSGLSDEPHHRRLAMEAHSASLAPEDQAQPKPADHPCLAVETVGADRVLFGELGGRILQQQLNGLVLPHGGAW